MGSRAPGAVAQLAANPERKRLPAAANSARPNASPVLPGSYKLSFVLRQAEARLTKESLFSRRGVSARAAGLVAAVLAALVALALAASAEAVLPRAGVFVPGESLSGVSLGMTQADVLRLWGSKHGVCRSCVRTTWLFNYRKFEPEGAGVVFRKGRVVRVFTIWKPAGWRTDGGLTLGADVSEITRVYGALEKRVCAGYYALVRPEARAQSVFYVFGSELWGFGLTKRRASPCL